MPVLDRTDSLFPPWTCIVQAHGRNSRSWTYGNSPHGSAVSLYLIPQQKHTLSRTTTKSRRNQQIVLIPHPSVKYFLRKSRENLVGCLPGVSHFLEKLSVNCYGQEILGSLPGDMSMAVALVMIEQARYVRMSPGQPDLAFDGQGCADRQSPFAKLIRQAYTMKSIRWAVCPACSICAQRDCPCGAAPRPRPGGAGPWTREERLLCRCWRYTIIRRNILPDCGLA